LPWPPKILNEAGFRSENMPLDNMRTLRCRTRQSRRKSLSPRASVQRIPCANFSDRSWRRVLFKEFISSTTPLAPRNLMYTMSLPCFRQIIVGTPLTELHVKTHGIQVVLIGQPGARLLTSSVHSIVVRFNKSRSMPATSKAPRFTVDPILPCQSAGKTATTM
jgi:hypothetical protein